MPLTDITIVAVCSARRAEFLAFSARMAAVYRDHGAISVVDYWQSSVSVDQGDFHADGTSYEAGELRSMKDLVGADTSESVVVTVTTWPSRETRERGTAAATRDPRVLETMHEEPLFDGRRVVGGSFEATMNLPPEESA